MPRWFCLGSGREDTDAEAEDVSNVEVVSESCSRDFFGTFGALSAWPGRKDRECDG